MSVKKVISSKLICLLFWLTTTGLGSVAANSPQFPKIETKFPSASRSCEITDAVIDYGRRLQVVLEIGKLYGRRNGADFDYFFIGKGHVDIIDTTGLVGRQEAHYEFQAGYLCGKDLLGLLGIATEDWREDKINRRDWQKLQFMTKTPDKYFGVDLAGELGLWSMNEKTALPIWADLEIDQNKELVIFLTPDIPEQLNVYLLDKKYDTPYILTGFSLGEQLETHPARIDSSHISVALKEMGIFEACCTLYFPSETDRRGIKLVLPHLYKVDSITDESGRPLPYLKKHRRAELYVSLLPGNTEAEPVSPTQEVRICFNGKFLQSKIIGVDAPVNMTTWFPQLPHRNLGGFTIDYTFHKDLDLISVGEKISETVEGEFKKVTYKTPENISYISFASGVYDRFADSVCGRPITLFVRQTNTQGLFSRNIPRNVLQDLMAAYSTFCSWYGLPLAQSLDIVDQPIFSFQSSPGLIHLSEISFYARQDQEHYRAHEVAHQWWGHTAVPASYRDMWLSEGLAEISAALYLLKIKRDSLLFERMVDSWRDQIIQEGKINGVYSRGYKAGSILQGARLLQSFSPADYVSLVYSKAAYMLLMLRFEMDGPEYRTDFFSQMLADYCRSFHGIKASSIDFIGVVQKYVGGERANSFFRQWLIDWKIPRFTCQYRIDYDDRGWPLVRVLVEASDVDDDFQAPYPVEIEFADGIRQSFQIISAVEATEYPLGPFPQKIKKIRFNPQQTILELGQKVIER